MFKHLSNKMLTQMSYSCLNHLVTFAIFENINLCRQCVFPCTSVLWCMCIFLLVSTLVYVYFVVGQYFGVCVFCCRSVLWYMCIFL